MSDWRAYTYDPRQFAAQPGGVFPHQTFTVAGRYFVYYGPVDKLGLRLPPVAVKKAGPFLIQPGRNYTCVFIKPDGVLFNEGAPLMYSVSPGRATVYVRTEMTVDVFLGVRIAQ